MLSEECVRGVLGRGVSGLSCGVLNRDMSTLSVRAPGLQATTMLDTGSLRVRGVTTLDSVRRNLFGCSNSDENRRFLERELTRQLDLDSQRWGFDFSKGAPLPGVQKFCWQIVPDTPTVTNAGLRRTSLAAPNPSAPAQQPKAPSPDSNKTQKRITDFLKPRKRLSNGGKKSPSGKHECGHGAHIRPPKVARLAQTHFKRTS